MAARQRDNIGGEKQTPLGLSDTAGYIGTTKPVGVCMTRRCLKTSKP